MEEPETVSTDEAIKKIIEFLAEPAKFSEVTHLYRTFIDPNSGRSVTFEVFRSEARTFKVDPSGINTVLEYLRKNTRPSSVVNGTITSFEYTIDEHKGARLNKVVDVNTFRGIVEIYNEISKLERED